MIDKKYNNSEYFAREFRDCLEEKGDYGFVNFRRVYKRKFPGKIKATQHGSRVDFELGTGKYSVVFECNEGENIRAGIEGIANSSSFKLKLKRTPKGKISPPALIDFFDSKILPLISKNSGSK